MGRRKTADQKVFDSKFNAAGEYKVFNNPLLIDRILNYSVYKPNGKKLDNQVMFSTRLVNKTWLQSVSRLLKKSGDSVIKLTIGSIYRFDRLNGKNKRGNGRNSLLCRFLKRFSKVSRLRHSILPTFLEIESDGFAKENEERLNNFLEFCDDIVSRLHVDFPFDGGSMDFKYGQLEFPILRTFEFCFRGSFNRNIELRYPVCGNNAKGWELLQDILKFAQNLQTFTLWSDDLLPPATNTSFLSLPASIKTLNLYCTLTINQMSIFTDNTLKNLQVIGLFIHETVPENLISKILHRFQSQLTKCFLSVYRTGIDAMQQTLDRISIELPLMEKLKTLSICGNEFSLSEQVKNAWSKRNPNLATLSFEYVTELRYFEWVQDLKFENVQKLNIQLFKGGKKDFENYNVLSENICKNIQGSFPNIQKLTLTIKLEKTRDLNCLFLNLTFLTRLRLNFDVSEIDEGPTGLKLVSILLGISLEHAYAIASNNTVVVAGSPFYLSSPLNIMKMRELVSLTLWTRTTKETESDKDIFLSKIISKHALEKMPKLKKIKLLGGFKNITLG